MITKRRAWHLVLLSIILAFVCLLTASRIDKLPLLDWIGSTILFAAICAGFALGLASALYKAHFRHCASKLEKQKDGCYFAEKNGGALVFLSLTAGVLLFSLSLIADRMLAALSLQVCIMLPIPSGRFIYYENGAYWYADDFRFNQYKIKKVMLNENKGLLNV